MSLKKRILVIGPISDFGGREIMTNLLTHSLEGHYEVRIVSTTSMSKHSVALKGTFSSWDTINYYLYRRYPFLKLSALLTKFMNRRKEQAYEFINNRLSKRYFQFERQYINSIKQFVNQSSCVLYSGEIDGKWFEEIIEICCDSKTPIILRITGEIKQIPTFLQRDIPKLHILAHSLSNATKIGSLNAKVWHIDQTTVLEGGLLQLEILENSELTYGFLGRFSPEKGILEVLDIFSKTGKRFKVAGDGPLLQNIKSYCAKYANITYEGKLSPDEVSDFYGGVDVYVISSYEEGGPIVGVEAMAAGKLIVSTRVGAMEERLKGTDNKFWFNINDENTLKTVIDQLESLSTLVRNQIRVGVRQKYLESNSLLIIKERYLEVFREILADPTIKS